MRGGAGARAGAVAAALLGAAPAAARGAATATTAARAQRVLVSGRGTLESVITDDRGHLFFTDADAGELLRMDRRQLRAAGARSTGSARPAG